jgi:2-phosphosulfolactate phosphatase
MPKIHVLLKKEELDGVRLPGKVVIVLDVLFATSTIVTALASGAKDVIPTLDEAAARRAADGLAQDSYVISGELNAITIAGFAPPTPQALVAYGIAGKTLIYCTTNGTVALGKSADAAHVYAASLLNGPAVVSTVADEHMDRTILIVCSGSADNFNLEDFFGAGYLVDLFASALGPSAEFSDAALAARFLYKGSRPVDCLLAARVGRMMVERGVEDEVRYAAQRGKFDVVPVLVDGRLVVAYSPPPLKKGE